MAGGIIPSNGNLGAARRHMIETQLKARGISDSRVLDVIGRLPRERFLPPTAVAGAYDDCALPIGLGQTISQPFIVAYMTEQLQVEPNHRVLEIGTGTGYQTAILAALAKDVFTVERLVELSADAEQRLASLDIHNVAYRVGDGSLGWPEHAPYDRIIATAGAPSLTRPLVDQLIDGGRLIMPVGEETSQYLTLVEKKAGRIIEKPLIGVRFVRLIGSQAFAN